MKTALITGAYGQDGYFLTKYLVGLGNYKVICTDISDREKDEIYTDDSVYIEVLDITKTADTDEILKKYKPDEIYHLAAFATPIMSWEHPEQVILINGYATTSLLDSVHRNVPDAKFFFSSSGKIFSLGSKCPQKEDTNIDPLDPYSLGKYIGHQSVKMYREKYGMFACNGILYNHESYLKDDNFVTYKICKNARLLKEGKINSFSLYNLDSEIDLGDPRDYVRAMHMILQQENPDDYVVSMNKAVSIREICLKVGEILGIPDILSCIEVKNPSIPGERSCRFGDNSKLRSIGWEPSFDLEDTLKMILDNVVS